MKRVVMRLLAIAVLFGAAVGYAREIVLTDAKAREISARIFQNECGGKDEALITWNRGEDFMSLGIGHCIWYPARKPGPFKESFPALVRYLQQQGVALPSWLATPDVPPCPWMTRDEFLRAGDDQRIIELRDLLLATKELQFRFMVGRLQRALPEILASVPPADQPRIETRFDNLAATYAGLYALVDYVNFNGEGTLPTERYQGRGWGLLQVLEGMEGEPTGRTAVDEFARSARRVVAERVRHAPPERNEGKWVPGWTARLLTYSAAAAQWEERLPE